MRKYLIIAIGLILIVGVGVAVFYKRDIDRAATISTLFSGAEQYQNFNRMKELFPHSTMLKSTSPFDFSKGQSISLPASFGYDGAKVDTTTFLEETDTSAILVLKNGEIIFEEYWLTGGRDVNWMSMSVAKSFVSAALGIAVAEGDINSIEDPITKYVPELAGSAYDGVRIKDVLQMSSGARWNEDYSDPESDINRFGRVFALGGSLNELTATLGREREPGTYNQYNSMDTQALGMLLMKATRRSITDYMQEKLWQPLGMESDGFWLIDGENMEMAFGGLNATARDYAKLGELFRQGGNWHGNQIVSEAWVKASVTPDAPHLMPGDNPNSDYPMGYGYQWWLMDGDEGEYSAIGVYNQFIYVNPIENTVIVKLSANSDYGMTEDESSYREFETIEFLRAITAQ